MARSKPTRTAPTDTPQLGEKGEKCAECGAELAPDQRYCLRCGARRTGPRVDFQSQLSSDAEAGAAASNGVAAAPATPRQFSPLVAIFVLALLGVMLLVGVLIGKNDADDENSGTSSTPVATQTASAVTPTTATAPIPPTGATPAPTGTTPVQPGNAAPVTPGAAGATGTATTPSESEAPSAGGVNKGQGK